MPRIKKPTKVKEPVRLRAKKLADGSQSLYLDIYRFGWKSQTNLTPLAKKNLPTLFIIRLPL